MESTEKTPYFRKLYISFSQNRQNVPGRILFREPNNIVCRVKQYSFTSQTQLFRPRKSNLWKVKAKNWSFTLWKMCHVNKSEGFRNWGMWEVGRLLESEEGGKPPKEIVFG